MATDGERSCHLERAGQLEDLAIRLNGTVLLLFSWMLFSSAHDTFAQQSPTQITGVKEPLELAGEAKKIMKPPEALRELGDVFPKDEKDPEAVKHSLETLTRMLAQNPDWSDGFYLRALLSRCMLQGNNREEDLKDLDTAISRYAGQQFPRMYGLRDFYSLRAKAHFSAGRFRQAMDDLDKAVRQDLGSAAQIFNSGEIAPTTKSSPCLWSRADLDTLTQKFPKDYRPYLYSGLYLTFFTTFGEDHYANAMKEIQAAISTDPRAATPYFFLGSLFTKASFWTKAAWTSDEARKEAKRKAIAAYTKAIQLDAKLTPAYRERAGAYLLLKQYRQAIEDFDRLLKLQPDDTGAYHDRALAKLELGNYYAAVLDFDEAIRRSTPDSSTIQFAYLNRSDAYMKVGEYQKAIADLTKAIEEQLKGPGFLLSLQQWRALYPEYSSIADETFVKKLNALFWPQYDYTDFTKHLDGNQGFVIGSLKDLYEKRGDAYLTAGDFKSGVKDFNRIYDGIPDYGKFLDRWRQLGTNVEGAYFLDIKTVQFPINGYGKMWLKTAGKKGSTIEAFEIDCRGRRLNQTSTIVYGSEGKVLSSHEGSTGWRSIVPDSMGEQLHRGLCN